MFLTLLLKSTFDQYVLQLQLLPSHERHRFNSVGFSGGCGEAVKLTSRMDYSIYIYKMYYVYMIWGSRGPSRRSSEVFNVCESRLFCHNERCFFLTFQAVMATNGTSELLSTEHIWYPRIREVNLHHLLSPGPSVG